MSRPTPPQPQPGPQGPQPSRPPDDRPPPGPGPQGPPRHTPADFGRQVARKHAKAHPLTDHQVDDAARILAAVARERQAAAA